MPYVPTVSVCHMYLPFPFAICTLPFPFAPLPPRATRPNFQKRNKNQTRIL
ncbi:hypothetical protein LJC08_05815 [Methanimicrococcus sp. OttesenSCG-928-J09]|nr:hypothetical protein [Methanimicrococcus sp. OttesenSCG-928-J09]